MQSLNVNTGLICPFNFYIEYIFKLFFSNSAQSCYVRENCVDCRHSHGCCLNIFDIVIRGNNRKLDGKENFDYSDLSLNLLLGFIQRISIWIPRILFQSSKYVGSVPHDLFFSGGFTTAYCWIVFSYSSVFDSSSVGLKIHRTFIFRISEFQTILAFALQLSFHTIFDLSKCNNITALVSRQCLNKNIR